MSENADGNQYVNDLLAAHEERQREGLLSLGVLPPPVTPGLDGGVREIAPPIYPDAVADHNPGDRGTRHARPAGEVRGMSRRTG
jgi:hypothetical protein